MRSTAILCLFALALSVCAVDEAVPAKDIKIATINLERIKETVGIETLAVYFMDEDSMAEYKALTKKHQEKLAQKKEAGLRDGDRLASEIKKIEGKMEDMREEAGLANAKKLNRALIRYIKKTYGESYPVILDAKTSDDGTIIHAAGKCEDITDKAIETLKSK